MKRQFLRGMLALSMLAMAGGAMSADTLGTFGPESFRDIAAAEQGKPFVVLVWSLDCAYCEQSFAALAQARRKHGLKVITVATDRAEDADNAAQIRRRLDAAGLKSDSWAFGNAPAEQLRYAIDPAWRGEMPRSYWFNARGEKVAHSGLISAQLADKMMAR